MSVCSVTFIRYHHRIWLPSGVERSQGWTATEKKRPRGKPGASHATAPTATSTQAQAPTEPGSVADGSMEETRKLIMRVASPEQNRRGTDVQHRLQGTACERYTCQVVEDTEEERAARAALRRTWPVRAWRLGQEPGEDLSATTTAAERLAMMWPLALDAWASAGQPVPDYPRRLAPIRVVRRADRDPHCERREPA